MYSSDLQKDNKKIDYDWNLKVFYSHFIKNEANGYHVFCKRVNKDELKDKGKILGSKLNNIYQLINIAVDEESIYFTMNTFFKRKNSKGKSIRSRANLYSIRGFVLDFDCHEDGKDLYLEKIKIKEEIDKYINDGVLPQPTAIINSGRGYHLYYFIRPVSYKLSFIVDNIFQEIKKRLTDSKYFDKNALGLERLIRMPGSIHERTKQEVLVEQAVTDEYGISDLAEFFGVVIKKKDEQTNTNKKKKNKIISGNYTYTSGKIKDMLRKRIRDLEKLVYLRRKGYKTNGWRELLLHIYSIHHYYYYNDLERLKNDLKLLNSNFQEPLELKEIESKIVQQIEKGQAIYKYRTKTIIEYLNITEEEQEQMQTLCSEKIRKRMNRRKKRGCKYTNRQIEKYNLMKGVWELYVSGYKTKEIADMVKKTPQRVSQILKEIRNGGDEELKKFIINFENQEVETIKNEGGINLAQAQLRKKIYQKYYTPAPLARYIVNKVKDVIGTENIEEYLEPSAGAGVFLEFFDKPFIAFDIYPENPQIQKVDFLLTKLQYKRGRVVLGNPPFSHAKDFIQKGLEIADYVAFILPEFYYKKSLKGVQCIYKQIITGYEFSGLRIDVCFVIYKRIDEIGIANSNSA